MEIFDPQVAYDSIDSSTAFSLIELVRHGIGFAAFDKFADKSPFSINEWCTYLHLSERTCSATEVKNVNSIRFNQKKLLQSHYFTTKELKFLELLTSLIRGLKPITLPWEKQSLKCFWITPLALIC